jgi:putative membrane protein
MQQMTTDHQATVELFQQAARSSDADVKEFAVETLPTLEQHLKEAVRVRDGLASADRPARHAATDDEK